MGLNTDLLSTIQGKKEPLKVLSQCVEPVGPLQPAVSNGPSVVVLVDLLCRFYAMSRLIVCTTDQLVEMVLKPWYDTLTAYGPRLRVFVACIDQPLYKKLEKKRHSRPPDSNVNPYPNDASFTNYGIISSICPVPQKISVDRLLHPGSRHLRHRLWSYICIHIQRYLTLPENTYFIFDYEVDGLGPMVKRGNDSHSAFMPHHAHQRAEADLAFPYWSLVFGRDFPVVWHTIDSDVLAIGTWMLAQYPELRIQNVVWHRTGVRAGGDITVNLTAMAEILRRGFAVKNDKGKILGYFTYDEWLMLCLISGTDYTDKKNYTYGMGLKTLVQALCCLPRNAIDICDVLLQDEPVSTETFTTFMEVLFARIQERDIDKGVRGVKYDAQKRYHAKREVAVKEFNDLLAYWRVHWDMIPFDDKGRRSIFSLDAAFATVTCNKCTSVSRRVCTCKDEPRGWWNHDPECPSVNLIACVCSPTLSDPMLTVTPPEHPLELCVDDLPPMMRVNGSFILKASNKRSSREFIQDEQTNQRPRIEEDPLFLGGFEPATNSIEDTSSSSSISIGSSSPKFPLLPMLDDRAIIPGLDEHFVGFDLMPLENSDAGFFSSSSSNSHG